MNGKQLKLTVPSDGDLPQTAQVALQKLTNVYQARNIIYVFLQFLSNSEKLKSRCPNVGRWSCTTASS